MTSRVRGLHTLARLHGVQTSYFDTHGERQQTSEEALLAVLQAFGAPLRGAGDVPAALRERRQTLSRRVLPTATVVWEGTVGTVEFRVPRAIRAQKLSGSLILEEGHSFPVEWDLGRHSPSLLEHLEGEEFKVYRLPLQERLPRGYHRLTVDVPGSAAEALVIVAPAQCAPGPERDWGVFLPLHALRTANDWGIGDYVALDGLSEWASGLGASAVGTLPLLPTFLDNPLEPSPYAPVSRLAWNPVFIDVMNAPGAREGPTSSQVRIAEIQEEAESLRNLRHVDYKRVMALKRRVLERLSADPTNEDGLRRFAESQPTLDAYAQFMAARETQGPSWREWSERLREGRLGPGDYARESWRYHLYGQMAASEQMEALSGGNSSAELYLDYPVGVHPDGFDVWREQERFVTEVTVGAPPDAFFTRGQDWGFNPLHPERSGDHAYFIASLRHHLRYASLLRLDHVMGLHRLYWVPRGAEPTNGAYVRYPAEELYAVLAIESHRHATGIVGEDLGTVPPEVPRSMARHGLKRLFVLQFAVFPDRDTPVGWPSKGMVASVDTHDTPPFASYWRGLDIEDRRELGLLDDEGVRREWDKRRQEKTHLLAWLQQRPHLQADQPREQTEQDVQRAIHLGLAASRADLVFVNLEDLWLEPEPQNVPGTSIERPNWRRKARYTLEEFSSEASVKELLTEVTRLRGRVADERTTPSSTRGSDY